MGWSDWNYINVFCVLFSGYLAIHCFDNENPVGGWLNVFASSLNAAIVAVRIL